MKPYSSGHYSLGHDPVKLAKWAEKAAPKIVKLCQKEKIEPIFSYSGMSGISHTTALILELTRRYPSFQFGLVYARKKGEKSHGADAEYKINRTGGTVVLVDDFISEGCTAFHVLKTIRQKILKDRWNNLDPATVKLLHNGKLVTVLKDSIGCRMISKIRKLDRERKALGLTV